MLETALTQPATYLVLVVLLGAALYYAYRTVRPLRRRDPDHGQTAWLVVVGVAGTGLAYTLIVIVGAGLLAGLEHLALLVLCFIVAGIPMTVEYIDDYTTRRQQGKQNDVLAEINHMLQGED